MPLLLGDIINQARRARRWSLRQLAAQVTKDDGTPISQQYLNDIELNRRIPAPPVLRTLAQALELDYEVLLLLAGGGQAAVKAYVAAHPQQEAAVLHLFRVAQQYRFEDWERLTRLVEDAAQEEPRDGPLDPRSP